MAFDLCDSIKRRRPNNFPPDNNSRRGPPILTVEAQVYHMYRGAAEKGEGKQQWEEMSPQPVCVHVYEDVVRGSYRVLSVDGSKPLINYFLTPALDIQRNGAKFIYWSNKSANAPIKYYGLGFENADDANLIQTKLNELKATLQQLIPPKKDIAARADPPPMIDAPVFCELRDDAPSPVAASEPVIRSPSRGPMMITSVEMFRPQTERMITDRRGHIFHRLTSSSSSHTPLPREFISQASPNPEFGQNSIDENKSVPRQQFLETNKPVDVNGSGGDEVKRQTLLQLHKAMGEKLDEAMALHKAMMNFL